MSLIFVFKFSRRIWKIHTHSAISYDILLTFLQFLKIIIQVFREDNGDGSYEDNGDDPNQGHTIL